MDPTVTFLLSLATLPRPTLWAVPSPVVLMGANVTLRCQGPLGSEQFQLWKDGELREERNASWELAEFVLRKVDGVRDARSYSCRSGQGPWWSDLSEVLALTVMTGDLPKPTFTASKHYIISPGTKVTTECQILPQESSQDNMFALLEAKSLQVLQRQSTAEHWAFFSLPSVRAEDSGNYSCIYYRKNDPHSVSHPSEALELSVSGQLPQPTLWAQPGLVLAQGANLTFWCSRPKLFSLEEVTFSLWKAGTQEPLRQQSSAEPWTSFLLPSVRPQDTGSYSCAYREGRAPDRGSEPSEALELVVPGSLPKPSLSALPGLVVEPRTHVTLQCQQPPQSSLWGVTFTLLKVGTPQPLQTQSPAGSSADFPLLSVRAQDAGNYSCVYYGRMAPSQVSEPSEVLEIWVAGDPELKTESIGKDYTVGNLIEIGLATLVLVTLGIILGTGPCNTIIITLSCVSFLLLLLCLLLLALLCRGSIPKGSLQEDSPRSAYPHHLSEAPREEILYTEVAKVRSREPLVHVAEEWQGVTYSQLNINTLKERKTDSKEPPTEPTLYATVSRD